ncbi:MAG: LpqB family beta-propeller domain-containing protein [Microbacterium sp.]|uniref:LpqB family beta-propeller domain-containing protein n=1 Tax=Microbacterium sp. TaxID=51671 RepID=UPI00261F999E|nr:LpqB family beta-propeller domain-containing protein [Microbacterium sp.]MCX6501874.1 LpqB family beta-propeller domain-containing protein [Microbacterium sp.]
MRVIALSAVLCALAGCAGLPTSGPVQAGRTAAADADQPSLDFRPDGPQPGASPQQIVDGFITAASSPEDGWAIAQMFLSPDFRSDWAPQAGVIVDAFAEREYAASDDGTSVVLTTTPVGTVDAAGTYSLTEGGETPLGYRLAQQDDGQWRITEAPAGLVMDEDLFNSVFHSYRLMYFDPTWNYLVPDVRWFPTLNAAGRIASALVNGAPVEWLADSVVTAFPETVDLIPAVPVSGAGVAQAELSEQALAVDDLTLDRMQTQLSASLSTAGVTTVELLVDGTMLEAQRLTTVSTKVDARALVLTPDGFGFLVSGELTEIPGLSEAIEQLAPVAVQTAPDLASAAVRLPDGTVARVLSDGTVTVVDRRAGLLDPTIDPTGAVWSVPSGAPGDVQVATADGDVLTLGGAWSGAARISSMQISRDGTRMAAVLAFGGRSVLAVAGVARDARGTPSGLSDPQVLAVLPGDGDDVGWLDDAVLGAVVSGPDPVYTEVPIGGAADVLSAPAGAAWLAGSNVVGSARVLATDGSLYVRRSSTWVQVSSEVSVLAVQQGSTD